MENDLKQGNGGPTEQPQGTVADLRLGSDLYARYASFPTLSPVSAGIANRLAHFGSDSRLPLAQRILQRWSSRGLSRWKLPGLDWLNDFRSDPRTRVALASARPVAKLSRVEAPGSLATANVVQLSAPDATEGGAADFNLHAKQTAEHVQARHSGVPESVKRSGPVVDPENVAHGSVFGTATSHIKRPALISAAVAARVANIHLAGDVFTEGFKESPVSKKEASAVARVHAESDQNAGDVRRVHSKIVETMQRHVSGVSSADDGSKSQTNAASIPWTHADRSEAVLAQETPGQPAVEAQGAKEASRVLEAKRDAVSAGSDKTIIQTERNTLSSAPAVENPRIAQRHSEPVIMGPPIYRRTVNSSSKTAILEHTSTPPGSMSDPPIGRAAATTLHRSVEALTSSSPLDRSLGQIVARVPKSVRASVGASETPEVSESDSIVSRVDAAVERTSPKHASSKSGVLDGASLLLLSELPKVSAEPLGGKVTALNHVHASPNSAGLASAVNNEPLAQPLEGIVSREQTLYKADDQSPPQDQRTDSLAKLPQSFRHPPAAQIGRQADNVIHGSDAVPTAELAHQVSAALNSNAKVDGPSKDIALRAVPLVHEALPSNLSRSSGSVHKNEASTSRQKSAAATVSPFAVVQRENSSAVVPFTQTTNQRLARKPSAVSTGSVARGQRVHREASGERANPEGIRAPEKIETPSPESRTIPALAFADGGTDSPVFRAATVGEQPSHTANFTHVDPGNSSEKPLGNSAIASATWVANTLAGQEPSKDTIPVVFPARIDPIASPAEEHRLNLSSSISTGGERQNAPVERCNPLSKVRPAGDSKSRSTSTHGEWTLATRAAENVRRDGLSVARRIEARTERLLATPSSMPQLNDVTLVPGVHRSLGFSPAESTHRVLERGATPVRNPALTHRLAPSTERLQMAAEPNTAGAFSSMSGASMSGTRMSATKMSGTKMSATNSRPMLMPAVASAAPTPTPTLPTVTNQLRGNVRSSGKVEINQLANRVYDMLVRRLASEQQRRGQ